MLSKYTLGVFRILGAMNSAGNCLALAILTTALANAPPASKAVFRQLLGHILTPYATRRPDGSLQFSEPAIAEFYQELLRQVGVGVLPIKLRP